MFKTRATFDRSWLVFLAAAVIFLAVKISSAHYAVSDENTYYKMGELVAQGQVPYRDFFFAHFPLQIYLYALVFKLFGFNLLLLKLLSAAAVVAAAAFVFAITNDRLNPKTAMAATLLFLFSYGTLLFSNFPTGIELAMPFVMAAFYFFLKKRFLLSGFLLGMATITYQLSVLVLPIFFMAAALMSKDKKRAVLLRIAAGFTAVVGAVSLIFLLVAGWEFIRQVLLYHLQKPSDNIDKAAVFLRVVRTNALLLIAAAAALVSRSRTKTTVVLAGTIAAAYIAVFPIVKTAFNYYLLYALPFLAIAAAYGIDAFYSLITERIRLTRFMAAIAVAAIIVLSSAVAVRQFAGYDSQDFQNAEEISAYVNGNALPAQTIFGDDSTVPLISLLSQREITLNYVDNNAMIYQSGIIGMEETLKRLNGKIEQKELKFIILRRVKNSRGTIDFGIGTEERFLQFVSDNCTFEKEFSQYKLYDCLNT